MPRKYFQEHIDFLQEHYPIRSVPETTELFNERFGTGCTVRNIYQAASRNGIKCGVPGGRFNKGQHRSPATEFKKGNKPWNKGRKGISYPGSVATQFKKGNMSHTHRPIGTETVRSDGYTWVKTAEPKTWKEKHRIIWEEAHGPIPKGHAVIFADCNRQNFELENLILVSRGQLAILNKKKLLSTVPELTKTGIAVADLYMAVKEARTHQRRELYKEGVQTK